MILLDNFFIYIKNNNMALLFLVSFFNLDKEKTNNVAILTKDDIDIFEFLQIKQNNIIFNETINITEEILNKIIKQFKGYNIIKITIVNGIYTIYVGNYPIVLLEKVLQKNLNKTFCYVYIYI